MKAKTKTVLCILLLAILLALAACSGNSPTGNRGNQLSDDATEQMEDEAPEKEAGSSSEKPTSPRNTAPSKSPTSQKSSGSVDISSFLKPPSTKSNSTKPPSTKPLTYEEAMAICNAWLGNNAELTSYSLYENEYEQDEVPPPTFTLFGEHYYEFFVSYNWDDTYNNGQTHIILVHELTGELLSQYNIWTNGDNLTATIDMLDDWVVGKHAEKKPALLTTNEAVTIYNDWMDNRAYQQDDFSQYRISKKSHGEYTIFGEQYYFFAAEDEYMYWYNVLIHIETGEILFMYSSDGMHSETVIEQLDELYNNMNRQ